MINAGKISVTTKKMDNEVYKNYSGYPGGLKERPMKKVVADKGMKEVLRIAVKGMLPKNKLRKVMLGRLKIYADAAHPHEGQQPVQVKL